jgi:phosphate acetyltransferase
MTEEECAANLRKGNYFGTMLVKMGKADCLLGGATYSTADTIRPALQLVKTKPGAHLVSSCFILNREGGDENLRTIAMGDCAVNLSYEDSVDKEGNVTFTGAQKLAEVAVEIEKCAKTFGIDPKVAMLSFSTKGSAKHELIDKVTEATKIAHELAPDLQLDGELQADAALVPKVGASKAPGSHVAGKANVLVFPDLQAGNIGYKLVERFSGANAVGPILQGIAAPVNDLSRGCKVQDIVQMIIITANQAIK